MGRGRPFDQLVVGSYSQLLYLVPCNIAAAVHIFCQERREALVQQAEDHLVSGTTTAGSVTKPIGWSLKARLDNYTVVCRRMLLQTCVLCVSGSGGFLLSSHHLGTSAVVTSGESRR
jgi:hypothetical protein